MKKAPFLSEYEAWVWIAALIAGAPGAMIDVNGRTLGGLCRVVHAFYLYDVVAPDTHDEMIRRVLALLHQSRRKRVFLHRPKAWRDGVRLGLCLRFAEECAS